MINYYCNKYEIEKNAMDCVLDVENDMDKNSDNILEEQPFLKKISQTTPIVTIKYTEI